MDRAKEKLIFCMELLQSLAEDEELRAWDVRLRKKGAAEYERLRKKFGENLFPQFDSLILATKEKRREMFLALSEDEQMAVMICISRAYRLAELGVKEVLEWGLPVM